MHFLKIGGFKVRYLKKVHKNGVFLVSGYQRVEYGTLNDLFCFYNMQALYFKGGKQ